MNGPFKAVARALLCIGFMSFAIAPSTAAQKTKVSTATCKRLGVDGKASTPLGFGFLGLLRVTIPPIHPCTPRESRGFPLPDPTCSPGAINPTVTLDVLKNPKFRTDCVRDKAESLRAKDAAYDWYGTSKQRNCEKDHIVPLEIGGADTMDNIWPQCGPRTSKRANWYYVQKDTVEHYLAAMVKAGQISQQMAQRGVANDWTQYLDAANQWQAAKKKKKRKRS